MLEIADSIKCNNRRCKKCNKLLGYFLKPTKTGKYRKVYFYSNSPWKFKDVLFYRILCIDCFLEKFNRFPGAPNIVTYDFEYLLDAPKEYITITAKSRAVTLEIMQAKHGIIEGQEKFDNYCKKQSISNLYEYKKEKYNWTEEDFKIFNKSRAITLENMIKKYGKKEGTIKFKAYCKKQKDAGNTLNYFIEKYGKAEGTLKYESVNKQKAITIENMIRVHGEEKGLEVYKSFITSKGPTSTSISNISQELFLAIYNKLPDELKNYTYFGKLNNEYLIIDNNLNRGFLYDFVNEKTKTCIEFNGEHVHVNINALSELEILNWKSPFSNAHAFDVIKKDEYKNNLIKAHGFNLKIVWFKDYISNPNKVIDDCISFISQENIIYE